MVVPVVSATVSAVAPALADQVPGVGDRATLAPVPVMTSVPAATVAVRVSVTVPVPAVAEAAPALPRTTASVPAMTVVRRMINPSGRGRLVYLLIGRALPISMTSWDGPEMVTKN
ncbi:MAG: hypothetical protein NVSMB55_08670 [Mycobacteriales bacterium]